MSWSMHEDGSDGRRRVNAAAHFREKHKARAIRAKPKPRADDWKLSPPCAATGKRVYPNRKVARQMLRRNADKLGVSMRPYRCPACGAIHVGHDAGERQGRDVDDG